MLLSAKIINKLTNLIELAISAVNRTRVNTSRALQDKYAIVFTFTALIGKVNVHPLQTLIMNLNNSHIQSMGDSAKPVKYTQRNLKRCQLKNSSLKNFQAFQNLISVVKQK